ncbi:CPBP family intramembrane glutamic endopeptidase [uncultured Bacteroides sp.]|uniref:CPBP family intramembrane glutamic endopeptidase n=1 Tax=uncultured Bacteroides sp. TaxID=162156 RepID=UPI0025F8A914|nr:type II CAAX endopeptidase family protein [uncultured Bacteroides sp.]
MKTAIKLILIDLLLAQIVAPILMMIPCVIYLMVTTGSLDKAVLTQMILIPAQLAGQVMMGVYLWKAGYISKEKTTWSPVSAPYQICSVLAIITCGFVVSALMSKMDWIPNIMEETFDILQSGWGGILAIAIIGPVFEELLFRGAITKALLQQYTPTKAILISALLFGVFHINPAQILPAFLVGILLAWTYYKTASLIPCILMHVLNNSLSVFLNINCPEAEHLDELIGSTPYLIFLCVSVLIFVGTIIWMRRTTVPYPWKGE